MDRNKDIVKDIFKLSFLLSYKLVNYKKIIKNEEIPPSHIKVLYYLNYNKVAIISDLSLVLGISKPNMTPIVDKLIDLKYIKKESCQKDKRKIYLVLTEVGIKFLKDIDKKVMKNIEGKINSLNDKDLENMGELIVDLNEIIDKI